MSAEFQKFKSERKYADAKAAMQRLLEIASRFRVDKGRMSVGEWNGQFLNEGGSVAEYTAGRDMAVAEGLIQTHECGGYVMLALAGRILFLRYNWEKVKRQSICADVDTAPTHDVIEVCPRCLLVISIPEF